MIMASVNLTTDGITKGLFLFFNQSDYRLNNTYMFNWECDFFCVTKAGYSYEIEVKISKEDFRQDFSCKAKKHAILSSPKRHLSWHTKYHEWSNVKLGFCYVEIIDTWITTPNRFYFCAPKGLISLSDIPKYAGLIEVDHYGYYYTKKAPFLHRQKNDLKQKLLSKFYHGFNRLKDENNRLKNLITYYEQHGNWPKLIGA